jgi:hypothetical protein
MLQSYETSMDIDRFCIIVLLLLSTNQIRDGEAENTGRNDFIYRTALLFWFLLADFLDFSY